jgi:transposase
MSGSFRLTEQQFARLEAFLPTDTRGVPRVDDRRVISGIVHVLKSGCRWKDAPVDYGPYKTLYNRFVRWRAEGRMAGSVLCPGGGWRSTGGGPAG